MTINRIGPSDPVNNISKNDKVTRAQSQVKQDSIKVSKSAIDKSDLIKAASIANNAPDIRADRVAEVKAKLADPNYINKTVIDSVADKIMEDFGI